MAYCVPHGIPHSTFLGSDTPGVWLDADADKALAWEQAMAEVCPECGTREIDWQDPATGRPWFPPKWEPVAVRCPGCAEIEREREQLPDGLNMRGVRVLARPFDLDRPDPGE